MYRLEQILVLVGLWIAGCDRAPPSAHHFPKEVAAEKVGESVQIERTTSDSPKEGGDGRPLFERFLGAGCALSRTGDTWCRLGASDEFELKPWGRGILSVAETGSPLMALLTADKDVRLVGVFVSDVAEEFSIDYSVPSQVEGLRSIVAMFATRGGFLFLLDSAGRVWRWQVAEKRDELVRAVRVEVSAPQMVLEGPVDRIFGAQDVCVQEPSRLWCFDVHSESPEESRYVPHSLPPENVMLAAVGLVPCFAYPKELHCYGSWSPPGLGPVRPMAHFVLPVGVSKLSVMGGNYALDRDGTLLSWRGVGSSKAELAEVEAPEVRRLKQLGRVRDFDDQIGCVISEGGELKCRPRDGSLARDVPVLAKFKKEN